MYQAQPITAAQLQHFYVAYPGEKTFLQSSAYAQYRHSCGEIVHLEGYFLNETLVAVVLIQELKTKLKHWLHVPHGPLVLAEHQTNFWPWWLHHYSQLGRDQKMDLVRVAPLLNLHSSPCEGKREGVTDLDHTPPSLPLKGRNETVFNAAGYKDAATHLVNPELTWVLDINKPEDELLAAMKKSTRYEVRKGIKPETDFTITVDQNLDTFWELHEATVARQGFVPFTRSSTEKELEAFGDDCAIITVWHNQKALASGVFLFDDKAGYYHQGASVPSKLPAAHAYLWAAICEAKKRGCTEFNFWGICDEDQKDHPWFGLSKFKRGFGGTAKSYRHVQDYEITWKAKLNRIIEARRKKKRGY